MVPTRVRIRHATPSESTLQRDGWTRVRLAVVLRRLVPEHQQSERHDQHAQLPSKEVAEAGPKHESCTECW
ncbi:MAG: hypothetical protein OXN89_03125 [Bryobacterales bacterium]|nr:hypothetical protein [Bryobacterales bacterium]